MGTSGLEDTIGAPGSRPSRILPMLVVLAVLVPAIGASASEDAGAPWLAWQSELNTGHPLAGRIWSARERGFVTPRALADDLSSSRYVLIGETHDNADHHRLQAWLIGEIARRRKPSVVMEMISRDQSARLDAYLAGPDVSAAGLGPALEWEQSGWPDWTLYQPIAEAALGAGLGLAAASPSRARSAAVSEGGLAAQGPDERERLALDEALPGELGEALHREIEESHCDLLPAEAVAPMADMQRFRDATMAEAMVTGGGDGAILIAGNGHVRSDRAVPWYLARLEPDAAVSSVMLLEVSGTDAAPSDLVITDLAGEAAADFFWFTPQASREDQCELLRRRFER